MIYSTPSNGFFKALNCKKQSWQIPFDGSNLTTSISHSTIRDMAERTGEDPSLTELEVYLNSQRSKLAQTLGAENAAALAVKSPTDRAAFDRIINKATILLPEYATIHMHSRDYARFMSFLGSQLSQEGQSIDAVVCFQTAFREADPYQIAVNPDNGEEIYLQGYYARNLIEQVRALIASLTLIDTDHMKAILGWLSSKSNILQQAINCTHIFKLAYKASGQEQFYTDMEKGEISGKNTQEQIKKLQEFVS